MAAIGLGRHPLREGGHVQGEHHPAAHGEDIRAGVGRRDGTEVGGVVDQRREEVGRRDEGEVVAQAVYGGVVERRQPDQQGGIERAGQLPHDGVERRRAHLAAQPPHDVHSVRRISVT